jgi:hypothetical protein
LNDLTTSSLSFFTEFAQLKARHEARDAALRAKGIDPKKRRPGVVKSSDSSDATSTTSNNTSSVDFSNASKGAVKVLTLKDFPIPEAIEMDEESTYKGKKNPVSPQAAIEHIDTLIQGQQKRIRDMNKLVGRAESFAAMRRASNHKLALLVSLNQIQKYQSQKELAASAIQDLNDLINEIDSSDSLFAPADYKKRAAEITEREATRSTSWIKQKERDEICDSIESSSISENSFSSSLELDDQEGWLPMVDN